MSTFTRRQDVVVRVEGDEILVLDTISETAHCLSGDVATVWQADEAATTVDALVATTGLSTDEVETALVALHELGLVSVATGGLGRRSLLIRGAAVGGAVVAAGVVSIPLPASARANSATWGVPTNTCTKTTGSGSGDSGKLTFTYNSSGAKLTASATYKVTIVYGGIGGPANHTDSFTFTTNASGVPTIPQTLGAPTNTNASSHGVTSSGSLFTFVYTTSSHALTWTSITIQRVGASPANSDQYVLSTSSLMSC